LQVAAIMATQVVLVTWVTVAGGAPSPTVAIVTSGGWRSRARGLPRLPPVICFADLDSAAVTAVIGAQAVVLFAVCSLAHPARRFCRPPTSSFLPPARSTGPARRTLAIGGTILPAVAVVLWQAVHPGAEHRATSCPPCPFT
jgi:hypothetical protein